MYMETSMKEHSQESGFALLMTLIVVGVVLSVGLSILDLSIKQIRLSTNAKESEISFHAANAGMECARYWRRENADEMEKGEVITPTCFGVSAGTITPLDKNNLPGTAAVVGLGDVFLYSYEFTWGPSNAVRCTQVDTLVASSSPAGTGATTTNMTDIFPGYPEDTDGPDSYCVAGSRCTVVSVRGYNRPCSTSNGYGTVEREVLLQL